jgi:hypothetical protein
MNNISVKAKLVQSLETTPAVLRRHLKLYFYGQTRRLRNSVASNFKARISFTFVQSLWSLANHDVFFKISVVYRVCLGSVN